MSAVAQDIAMIIDFHTHAFPDSLAEKAVAALMSGIDGLYPPVHDGTIAGLLANMDAWGIHVSVLQPVITKQSQTVTVNRWAQSVSSERIVSFGGIYPHTDDYKRDIDFAAGLGLKGLKFHAEYQDFILDEPKMLRIYDYALSRGLIILHHAGFDPGFPPPFHSNPQKFRNIARSMRGGVIVAAHLGGHAQWDDVERFMVGENIYIDTSMGFEFYPTEQFLRIVQNHGCDKILFGSDAPWSSAKTEAEFLKKLPLSEEAKTAILGGNAIRLLGLSETRRIASASELVDVVT